MTIDKSYDKEIIDFIKKNSNDNYYEFVFKYSLSFYEERVKMVDFTGKNRILDAGCGYGQWSLALSKFNEEVFSIDHSESMLKSTNCLINYYNVKNINVLQANLPKLDFDDNYFDGIWCWSVFMFLNRDEALKEFHRVLKPGGRILIGSKNSIGRVFYKIAQGLKNKNYQSVRTEVRNVIYGRDINYINNYTLIKDVEKLYEPYGFKVIAKNSEGFIDLSGENKEKPIFEPKFLGMYSNIEFILEKV